MIYLFTNHCKNTSAFLQIWGLLTNVTGTWSLSELCPKENMMKQAMLEKVAISTVTLWTMYKKWVYSSMTATATLNSAQVKSDNAQTAHVEGQSIGKRTLLHAQHTHTHNTHNTHTHTQHTYTHPTQNTHTHTHMYTLVFPRTSGRAPIILSVQLWMRNKNWVYSFMTASATLNSAPVKSDNAQTTTTHTCTLDCLQQYMKLLLSFPYITTHAHTIAVYTISTTCTFVWKTLELYSVLYQLPLQVFSSNTTDGYCQTRHLYYLLCIW